MSEIAPRPRACAFGAGQIVGTLAVSYTAGARGDFSAPLLAAAAILAGSAGARMRRRIP